jgi:hypothetical protein
VINNKKKNLIFHFIVDLIVLFFDQLEALKTDDDKVSCGGIDDTISCELADGDRDSTSY